LGHFEIVPSLDRPGESQNDLMSCSNLVIVMFEACQHDLRDDRSDDHHGKHKGETDEDAFRD
jgi:hypothetical protein